MPTKLRPALLALVALVTIAATAAWTPGVRTPAARTRPAADGPTTAYGPQVALGRGTARTYVRFEQAEPVEIGVVVDAAATASLPYSPPTDGQHCFDADGDGAVNPMTECVGGYGLPLALPTRSPAPYRWVLLNWNPAGHTPMGMYGVPHFDMHVYVEPRGSIAAIRPGRCALLVACDQIPEVTRPLPARYVPWGYPATMPETTEVGMGEHLDSEAGFQDGATFIYGAVNGRLAFLEPMVRLDALRSTAPGDEQHRCLPVAQPEAWERAGWYPSSYCFGRSQTGGYQISLDSLTVHDAD